MRFGPYEVEELVAVGSTATVYRARHTEIGRLVAIKELLPGLIQVPGALERLRGEARVLAGLDDPHVVAVYDLVEEDGRAWIAEQWVDGATLSAVVSAVGRLTPEQAVGAVRGALLGLVHAQSRGLVHGDVAPGNVITDMAGTSMLLDFGLAAPVGDAGVRGTPAFISPEAVRGEPLVPASDVYSAAAVLHLLLSGAPPFPAADVATALRRHRDDPPPRLAGPDDALADLLGRSMSKDPGSRPPDAAAFLAELEEAAERRFGVGWPGRAGLAGAVASVLGVAGQASAGTAVAVGTQAAIDTGTSAAPEVVPHVARALRPRTVAAAGVATVAVVAGVLLLRPDPQPAPRSSPSPVTSSVPVVKLEPNGRYTMRVTVVTSNLQAVGTVLNLPVDLRTGCTAGRCTGTIRVGTLTYRTTWDGHTLVATSNDTNPCTHEETGAVVGTYRNTRRMVLTGDADVLQGTGSSTQVLSGAPECPQPRFQTTRLVVQRA